MATYPAWFPITGTMGGNFGDGRGHEGYDLFGPAGAKVFASAAGTVSHRQEPDDERSYGLYIDIDHGAGYTTRYAHLQSFAVPHGTRVTRGQHIAHNGSSGSADPGAEHVHFEVLRNGAPLDLNASMPPRNSAITALTPIPAELSGFPAQTAPQTDPDLKRLMSLTVVDYKHPSRKAGRRRFVWLHPGTGKNVDFLLVVLNGAKIAEHPVGALGVAVKQHSAGAILGVEREPDGVHFNVIADDGGTFRYAFEA